MAGLAIAPFEELEITTMTLVIMMTREVHLDSVFNLLPVTYLNLPPPRRQASRYKIPVLGIPGAILSLRYAGSTRGIIRSSNPEHFRNSITIDISTAAKNISIKLSREKIHICGAKSEAMGVEGARYLIEHIKAAQHIVERIRSDLGRAKATIGWLADQTRGEATRRYAIEKRVYASIGLTINLRVDQGPDYLIKPLTESEYPGGVDGEIAQFLSRQVPDFYYHSDYESMLNWACTVVKVCEPDIGIGAVYKAMVNYNYNIGANIDRNALRDLINGRDGFFARFYNEIEHNVTIELPYVVPENLRIIHTRKKLPCHTFLIYRSGIVTQSGPTEELVCEAYYHFMQTISQLYRHIIQTEAPMTRPTLVMAS